mmetsp:Transcript_605/g.1422  ORF Transcript_605/g.1422 Transcript_605/m.1422 type:complete len:546 (+) Transcript_605:48-1685(+)
MGCGAAVPKVRDDDPGPPTNIWKEPAEKTLAPLERTVSTASAPESFVAWEMQRSISSSIEAVDETVRRAPQSKGCCDSLEESCDEGTSKVKTHKQEFTETPHLQQCDAPAFSDPSADVGCYSHGMRAKVDQGLEDFFVGGENDFGNFSLTGCIFPYSSFIPRLYNLVRSFGFRKDHIMPSRALCSDESQGAALLLLTKHFGIFPFNHGLVGGVVATEWHPPHAHHGDDLVILQASHVGYEPETGTWGTYRRVRCCDQKDAEYSPTCGAMNAVVEKYLKDYKYAQLHILVTCREEGSLISIDNELLQQRSEGLFLRLERLLDKGDLLQHSMPLAVGWRVKCTFSTRVEFFASPELHRKLVDYGFPDHAVPIGAHLSQDLFLFKTAGPLGQLEANLLPHMSTIVTSPMPHLVTAVFNTQREFDRTFRSILRAPCYELRDIFFVSGLNIDISPQRGATTQVPSLNFVPWAAVRVFKDGGHKIFEQPELVNMLLNMTTRNPDAINLEAACTDDRVSTRFLVRGPTDNPTREISARMSFSGDSTQVSLDV